MKKFTRSELENFGGRDGGPIYIAFEGKVYDVSGSFFWEGGDHQGEHSAGYDLTGELMDAPHDESMITGFPVVGEMED